MTKNIVSLILLMCCHITYAANNNILGNLKLNQQQLIIDCKHSLQTEEQQLQAFNQFITQSWYGDKNTVKSTGCLFNKDIPSISVLLRSDGAELAQAWSPRLEHVTELLDFIDSLKNKLIKPQQMSIDAIEIYISHSYSRINYSDSYQRRHIRSNIHTGMKGIEIQYGNAIERFHPGYPITRRLKNRNLIDQFFEKHNIKKNDAINQANLKNKLNFNMFQGNHLLITLSKPTKIYHLFRSDQLIDLKDINKQSTLNWINLAEEWLTSNVHADGRMTYRFSPSIGQEPRDNNMIRQWMATVSLGRLAKDKQSQKVWDLGEKNIDYNLKHFYHDENQYGVIEHGGFVKLGALSLAALAIIEHPKRTKWEKQEKALLRTIDSLWHQNGSFTPLYKPANRFPNWGLNFYPGETLLMWSVLYEQTKDIQLLDKIMKSFRYYRDWHLDIRNRKPSFIPWHTQAYYNVWNITKNKELKDFVFLMNDWLIEQMLASANIYPDTIGRFYNPNKIKYVPKGSYGVVHASSTGVYLEGLIDAYKIAKAVKDTSRAENYRIAMIKGLRSMMQLQFQSEADMYYIKSSDRKYVKGGVKESVYKNEIRCDNIQHAYMGILRIYNEFSENNYNI